MKTKIALSFVVAVLLAGCSFKGDTISLGEYKPTYTMDKKLISGVQIDKFIDSQRQKPLVAVVKDTSHETVMSIYATDDLGAWLSVAFSKELGALSVQSKDGTPVVVSARIVELYAEYTRNPAATKNIKLQAHIEMTMSKNGNSLKKEYFLKEERYAALLTESKELTPHIQDILSQIALSMSKDVVSWSAGR